MPRISRNPMEPATREQIVCRLCAAFQKINDARGMEGLFNNLFTRSARIMLAKRLTIAVLLARGVPYSAISKALKVSATTISFVRNRMLKGSPEYAAVIQSLDKLIS